MLSSPDDRRRVEAGTKMLAKAKEMRITSPGGTDVVYRLGKYNVVEQYGFTDIPGRWDAWPGVFLYTAAHDDGVNGTVVIDKGDMLLPLMRYASEPIRLTIERGMVTEIAGEGPDAELMRSFMAGFDDPRAYAVSHIGWGLDARASWEFMGTSPVGPALGRPGRPGLLRQRPVLDRTQHRGWRDQRHLVPPRHPAQRLHAYPRQPDDRRERARRP